MIGQADDKRYALILKCNLLRVLARYNSDFAANEISHLETNLRKCLDRGGFDHDMDQ